MRVLLTIDSRKKVSDYLKIKNNCDSIRILSKKINIPTSTLQHWFCGKNKYIPEQIIPAELINKLEVTDRKEDNWGQIKGGKKTYQTLVKKYGLEEIRRRQKNGGSASAKIRIKNEKPFNLDIGNPLFLEFYGVLLGDGWLSRLKWKNKKIYLIGISGDKRLDKEFFLYLKKNISNLFNRSASIKERKDNNGMEMDFSHKMLIKALNEKLDFPIGLKIDLKINDEIYKSGFEKMKHVIRGIFDTDGSFYFDKTPVGRPYPCISITMFAPKLMNQVHNILINQGFKAYLNKTRPPRMEIRLKGSKQLKKWMSEIGSNNNRHLNKIALVAQPG